MANYNIDWTVIMNDRDIQTQLLMSFKVDCSTYIFDFIVSATILSGFDIEWTVNFMSSVRVRTWT